jgi:hypothetical protein
VPLPTLKVEVPAACAEADARKAPASGPLALRTVLAMPFFIGAAVLLGAFGISHPVTVAVEILLLALGCGMVLTHRFGVAASILILGGVPLVYGFYVALMSGLLGGHQ